jgi:hypothetical protein
MATSGPGAIHLLNGLYDAKMDHQPVVAIVEQSSRLAMGGSYQQEVDLQSLFKERDHSGFDEAIDGYVQVGGACREKSPVILDRRRPGVGAKRGEGPRGY